MPKKPKSPGEPTELRRRAERQMEESQAPSVSHSETDNRRLLHELDVHQIELEMQNAELRMARDEAESMLEKYTDLYDFAPVGYFTLAADGIILLANLTGSTLVGTERNRLVGRSFRMLVTPGHRPAFDAVLAKVFENPAKHSVDVELSSDGQPPRPVNIEVGRAPDGSECRVVVVDITERKHAEEILRRNEALFSALIGQAPVGVYVVDSRFRLQQANPTALALFGNITPLIDRDFSEIIHILWPKRVAGEATARFRHTLKTGESYQSPEFAERRKDTHMQEVYEWQIQRVTMPAGEFGVVCFFNNITARKKAEKAQRRMEVLTASNLKLKREITHRRAVEETLQQTEHEQKKLLEQSRLHQEQLRDMSHQILGVQEEERKRISRELHDVIAQTLVAINVHLAALTHGDAHTPKRLQQKIAATHRLVEKSVEIVHRFALELRPTVLDDLGLIPALHSHLKGFMADTGIRASLKAYAGIEKASTAIRTALFRVAQESLSNVARHAGASRVTVSIENIKGLIRMKVTDDGQGFDVDDTTSARANNRLGMLGMRERIEMIGGTFCVDSAPGQATTIHVEIKPVQPPPRKRAAKKSAKNASLECP
ncbi:MAG: PAS domain S-box protein [Luteolibacter sp.]